MPVSATNLIAFDLGAESGRAVLGRLASGRLALTELHRFANTPGRMAGRLHWNLLSLWEDLKTGLRKAGKEIDGHGDLHGLGVDTWGVDFGLLDEQGELLGLPVCYRDGRTDGILERTFQRVARERIFQATGIQFLQFNTLFQLVAMRECHSSLLDSARRLLFMPDLLHYLFTGICSNEFSIVTTSQMYDPHKKDWARDLLSDLDLPTHILGPIVPSASVLGPLRDDVAAACGVSPIPVVAPASHDTASAVASVPAEGDDWCYISSGTWSLMGVERGEPIINEKSLRYNYTNEGGVGGSIRFLKNIMGLWLVQECRRHWARQGREYTYAELTRLASESLPFVSFVDPDHQPFLSPGDMPIKIEQFCQRTGQPIPATPGQFVRTCLESLALTYRRTLDGLEDILRRRIGTIHIVGGGCQNEMLNQMTADACDRSVVAGPIEATAIGNLLCQAMAIGQVHGPVEARTIVRNSFPVQRYEPRDNRPWSQAYDRYRGLLAG
jgi:rhamnulokinase